MKKVLSLLLAGLLGLGCAACSKKETDSPSVPPASIVQPPALPTSQPSSAPAAQGPGQLLWQTIPAPSLEGNLIGEETQQPLGICLPPSYGQGPQSYPVLYYLTGFTEEYRTRAETFFATLERLYQQASLPEMIVVVVNGTNRLGGCWYTNSPVTGHWEDYVTKDVIAFVDANFSTIASSKGRALIGHSMGGAGVISLSMHCPGLFSFAYALSPAVFNPKDFDQLGLDFDVIRLVQKDYAGMEPEAAAALYKNNLATIPAAYYWTLGYGSAFAPRPDGLPPYIQMPQPSASSPADMAAVKKHFLGGPGNLEASVKEYAEALKQLDAFIIDFGSGDENSWLPPGCEFLGQQLELNHVPHQLTAYEGKHNSHINQRIEEIVLPAFASLLAENNPL